MRIAGEGSRTLVVRGSPRTRAAAWRPGSSCRAGGGGGAGTTRGSRRASVQTATITAASASGVPGSSSGRVARTTAVIESEDPSQCGLEQVGLAVEVVVDGRRGDPGLVRDIVDVGIAETLTGEHLDRRVDNGHRDGTGGAMPSWEVERSSLMASRSRDAERYLHATDASMTASAAPSVETECRRRSGDGPLRAPSSGSRHGRRHRCRGRHDRRRRLLPLPIEGARAARRPADLHRSVPGEDPRAVSPQR